MIGLAMTSPYITMSRLDRAYAKTLTMNPIRFSMSSGTFIHDLTLISRYIIFGILLYLYRSLAMRSDKDVTKSGLALLVTKSRCY
jgi:carotenoid cleavage dioxygenase-like enzyme